MLSVSQSEKPILRALEGREWGVGSVVLESVFLGRTDFQSRGPKTLSLKTFGVI